nr:LPS assembly protein LptD [candidate division Zixibacteria bacterium]
MRRLILIWLFLTVIGSVSFGATGKSPLYLDYSGTYEFIRGLDRDTIFITDSVVFRRDDGILMADTAIWIKGESIILVGHVFVQDTVYQLSAHRVIYDINANSARASGDTVIIISQSDSVMAVGNNAYYSRDSSLFRMADRPAVYLSYQDSSRMVQIDADRVAIDALGKIGYADGEVVISQGETESRSGRAIMYMDDNILLLLEEPSARIRQSEVRGDTLILYGEHAALEKIHVWGRAEGDFREPARKDTTVFDLSELRASEIRFNLEKGELNNIVASGQAYSFYFPGSADSSEVVKNTVSGDIIKLFMEDRNMRAVEVLGGAEGEYLSGKYKTGDSGRTFIEDSVQYSSDKIDYSIVDSTIVLTGNAFVKNKTVSLTAHQIKYGTSEEMVTAYDDTMMVNDSELVYIPVILKDGTEEILGSYMEYSMDTEKGLILQSKSDYQEAYYRGRELFREEKEVYYVEDGTYTTCNLDCPHFHFRSHNMKMIQGDKVIARPVVFYIEKLPLMIIPYYVFPLKAGRHSGFLSFQIGNFERTDGYIHNVGYYWAASEYWDILAALDYNENYGMNYRSTFRYNIRYIMSGSVSGSYADETQYVGVDEKKTKRWQFNFDHSHTISPTFSIKASGTFLSDKSYYTDFSTDLDDRLNKNLRSQVSISKRWGNTSLSVQFIHNVDLDAEKRTDQFPTAALSLPPWQIFGAAAKDDEGREIRRWYNNIILNYRNNLNNYSQRTTDTAGVRSRREYMTLDHSASLSAPFDLFQYLKLNPSVSYRETWYKIYETDQSLDKGIDASQFYRRYAYSTSLRASTDLYGTINPKLCRLESIRHVISPSVTFSWSPEITSHNDIKSYTGVGGGGSESKSMSFSLGQTFQAKVKSGEEYKKLDILTISNSLSYDFKAEGRKFSYLTTTVRTPLLKDYNISVDASFTHDLYNPETDKLEWWSPYLLSMRFSTTFSARGILWEYMEPDTTSGGLLGGGSGANQNWNVSVSHHYEEYGRGSSFTKTHTVSLSGTINLSPSIRVTYSQSYDIRNDKTVSRRIEITKNLHCWQGQFYWVPDGSNRGYYFKLNIISIPDIKFEKSESGIRAPYL